MDWGAGYAVYDPVGQKIGSAEQVFVNLDGEPTYIRVRIGFLYQHGADPRALRRNGR
jgi:hypothetical protein